MVAIKQNLKQHKKRIMAANVNTGCLSSLFFLVLKGFKRSWGVPKTPANI